MFFSQRQAFSQRAPVDVLKWKWTETMDHQVKQKNSKTWCHLSSRSNPIVKVNLFDFLSETKRGNWIGEEYDSHSNHRRKNKDSRRKLNFCFCAFDDRLVDRFELCFIVSCVTLTGTEGNGFYLNRNRPRPFLRSLWFSDDECSNPGKANWNQI